MKMLLAFCLCVAVVGFGMRWDVRSVAAIDGPAFDVSLGQGKGCRFGTAVLPNPSCAKPGVPGFCTTSNAPVLLPFFFTVPAGCTAGSTGVVGTCPTQPASAAAPGGTGFNMNPAQPCGGTFTNIGCTTTPTIHTVYYPGTSIPFQIVPALKCIPATPVTFPCPGTKTLSNAAC